MNFICLVMCPTGAGVDQSRYARNTNLVVLELKHLRMELSGLENAHTKSEGMQTKL